MTPRLTMSRLSCTTPGSVDAVVCSPVGLGVPLRNALGTLPQPFRGARVASRNRFAASRSAFAAGNAAPVSFRLAFR